MFIVVVDCDPASSVRSGMLPLSDEWFGRMQGVSGFHAAPIGAWLGSWGRVAINMVLLAELALKFCAHRHTGNGKEGLKRSETTQHSTLDQ